MRFERHPLGLVVHRILNKNSLKDFLFRSSLPTGEDEALQSNPKFWELIDPDAKLEKIATGFGFTEGPVWDERGKFLYVSDESQNKLSRVFPDGRIETVLEIRDPDGSAFDKNGRLIV